MIEKGGINWGFFRRSADDLTPTDWFVRVINGLFPGPVGGFIFIVLFTGAVVFGAFGVLFGIGWLTTL